MGRLLDGVVEVVRPQLGKPPVVVIWEHVAQHPQEFGAGLLDRLLPRLRHNNDLHEPFVVRHIGFVLPELHMVTALFLL
jgi:hypothetical protein